MELNQRQLELYNFLKEEMQTKAYVPHPKIMLYLNHLYHREEERSTIENSGAYRLLRADITAINNSTAQHVILPEIIGGKLAGYKLAEDNQEIAKRAMKLYNEGLRKLKKASTLLKKIGQDGQLRFNDYETAMIQTPYERR